MDRFYFSAMGGNIMRKREEVLEVSRGRTRWKQFSGFVGSSGNTESPG